MLNSTPTGSSLTCFLIELCDVNSTGLLSLRPVQTRGCVYGGYQVRTARMRMKVLVILGRRIPGKVSGPALCYTGLTNLPMSLHLNQTHLYWRLLRSKSNTVCLPKTYSPTLSCRKIHLFDFTDASTERKELPFQLKEGHHAGSMVWGTESTAEHLFVSSEPSNPDILSPETVRGWHRALDVGSFRSLYDLDAEEAGDSLTLDPTGE